MSQTQKLVGLMLVILGSWVPAAHTMAADGVHLQGSKLQGSKLQGHKQLAFDNDELKIPVSSFELEQFKAMPSLGWTKVRVEQFLDEQLASHDQMFSLRELEVVARQLSIQMKQAGLMFSRALVNEQEVIDGRVAITFEDGLLGEVVVMDAGRTQPKLLARPFMSFLQNTAVRTELDEALYRLDRLPGIDVFGFFSFTGTPGLSRLNLRVIEERTWKALLHSDNHGSEAVGRERVHATLELLNMSGWGDKLKLNVGRSYSQPGFFEGYAQYTYPLGEYYQPLTFLVSNSSFELGQGFERLEVLGESTLGSVKYTHHLGLERGSLSVNVGASISDSKIDSDLYSELFFRESKVSAIDLGANHMTILAQGLSQKLGFGVRFGTSKEETMDDDSIPGVDETNFTSVSGQYQLQFFHNSASSPRVSFLDFQVFSASEALPSIEQTGFGGRGGVRGLPSGYFSADQGFLARIGHDIGWWPQSWPGSVRLFSDIAIGERIVEGAELASNQGQTAQFASVGVGYTWQKGKFSLAYDFGKVIHADLDDASASAETLEIFNENTPSRHYLSFSYDLGEH